MSRPGFVFGDAVAAALEGTAWGHHDARTGQCSTSTTVVVVNSHADTVLYYHCTYIILYRVLVLLGGCQIRQE